MLNVMCGFLPFVILPVCGMLTGVSGSIVCTTESLKTGRFRAFARVVFPLDVPKVVDNVAVIFMPTLAAFIVSSLLNKDGVLLVKGIVRRRFGRKDG